LQQLVAMNARLKSAAPEIIAARKSTTTTPAQVSQIISDSALSRGIAITWMDARGEYIQVRTGAVVFNDLLEWLNELRDEYALGVAQLDVKQAE
ncbi:type II secretion system protein M, partial [Escherichia coli]